MFMPFVFLILLLDVLKCLVIFLKLINFIHFTQENVDLIDRDDQQNFLAGADFLANNGLLALISNIQAVVTEVIEG
jgi:peroxin-3